MAVESKKIQWLWKLITDFLCLHLRKIGLWLNRVDINLKNIMSRMKTVHLSEMISLFGKTE